MVVARVRKIGTTLWTHKKKTILAGVVAYYAGRWVYRWDKNNQLRSAYALEAIKFGNAAISAEDRPRRVLVLANVSAKERGCYDDFTHNALPLMHLAGIEVNIIKADSESQLEALAAAVDKDEADAVYIVGGDGTIGRVITGIFRNHDQSILPIGAYPGGYDSLTLKRLVPSVFEEEGDIRRQCESAMALIEDVKQPQRAFTVHLSGSEEKPLYSIGDVGAGWFRHIEDKRKKLWYWGGFKRRLAYMWEMLKRSPEDVECQIEYEEYCGGCNRCRVPVVFEPPPFRWWHILTGTPRYVQPEVKRDYSNIVNESCGKRGHLEVKGAEFLIEAQQKPDDDSVQLHLKVGATDAGRLGVISEGFSRISNNIVHKSVTEGFYSTNIIAKMFDLEFKNLPEFIRNIYISSDRIKLDEIEGRRIKVESTDKTVLFYLPKSLRFDPNTFTGNSFL